MQTTLLIADTVHSDYNNTDSLWLLMYNVMYSFIEEAASPMDPKKELYPISDPERLSPDVEKSPHTKEGLLEELSKKLVAYESTFETQANEIAGKNMQLQQQSEEIEILQTEVKDLTKRLTAGPGSQVTQTHGEATMDVDTTGMLHFTCRG